MKCQVTHFGTATVLFEIGSMRLLTDPVFDPPGRRYSVLGVGGYRRVTQSPPFPSLGDIDAVLLSHDQHGDNLDVAGLAIARGAETVLTTVKGARRLGDNAEGLRPWETVEIEGDGEDSVRITATPAQHGPRWLTPLAGPVIGFVLQWPRQDGAVYISGDTVLFDGIREVARRFHIGTAFLHAGRATLGATGRIHYTLTAAEAAETIEILGRPRCVPIHYEGWSHFREGRASIEKAFALRGLTSCLTWLPPGEPVEMKL